MKTHSTAVGPGALWAQLAHLPSDVLNVTGRAAIGIRNGARNMMIQTQIARMQSVLNGMDDELLDQLGITRAGIRKHAEHLVTYKYDGL